jgi:hypothetical protein
MEVDDSLRIHNSYSSATILNQINPLHALVQFTEDIF